MAVQLDYFLSEYLIDSSDLKKRNLVFYDPLRYFKAEKTRDCIIKVEYHTGDTVYFMDGNVWYVCDSSGKIWF